MKMHKNESPFESILPEDKLWYSTKEAAYVLGKSTQYVRDCLDNQRILGHVMNGRAPKGKEKRNTYQISRASLLLFLKETANYDPENYKTRNCKVAELC